MDTGRDFDVVVVGAGVSGLVTARDVARAGHRVLLLEGRDRIGGRVWTTCAGDLGASWIHGASQDNPVFRLATEHKMKLVKTDYDSSTIFTRDGAMPRRDQERCWSTYVRLADVLEKRGAALQATCDVAATLQSAIDGAQQGDLTLDAERVEFTVVTEISHEFAADPSWLSAAYYDEGEDDIGGNDAVFQSDEGYGAVVTALYAQVSPEYPVSPHVFPRSLFTTRLSQHCIGMGSFCVSVRTPAFLYLCLITKSLILSTHFIFCFEALYLNALLTKPFC